MLSLTHVSWFSQQHAQTYTRPAQSCHLHLSLRECILYIQQKDQSISLFIGCDLYKHKNGCALCVTHTGLRAPGLPVSSLRERSKRLIAVVIAQSLTFSSPTTCLFPTLANLAHTLWVRKRELLLET